MLELMFCSLLTVFPDYLYRRFVQGKRFGKEITLYSFSVSYTHLTLPTILRV